MTNIFVQSLPTGSVVPGALTLNAQAGDYTAVLTDANIVFVTMTSGSANNFTVPTNASVAFSIGDQLLVTQLGAGQTTLVAAGGVTVNKSAATLKLRAQYSQVSIIKTATDTWLAAGDLAAS